MKKLLIVRHSKTSWKTDRTDFDRNLKTKGETHASFMGDKVLSRGLNIQKVLSSSANRTTQTTNILNKSLHLDAAQITFHKELYLAAPKTIIQHIKEVEDSVDELMIVAHNPGVTQVVNYLANEHFENVPTSGMACLLFDIDSWSEIKNNGTLGFYMYPKMFKQNLD
jgi:phosphohistidine phosphatase